MIRVWIEWDRIEKEAVMSKPAELRDQTDEQLEMLLREVQNNLFRLRLQSETERLEAPSEIVKAKREIARIKTILRQREIEREGSLAASATTALAR
jgi:large subunit ribosomal protein L29